ncbi:MAG: redox-sensing transcriptional repressor Rex [Candidatus Caldarchaeum sp.]
MQRDNKLPTPTLTRLATYYKVLSDAEKIGYRRLNSAYIERACGVSAAQFRKDLSYLGELGKPGVGYRVSALRRRIARVLHLDRRQRFALIGAGRLGQALAAYPGLEEYNFELAALFDIDPKKVGKRINGVVIDHADNIPKKIRRLKLKIAVLTVPASAAQNVAEAAVKGGIKWILNFTPAHIKVPEGCLVRDVVFTQEFAVLAHFAE